MLGLTKLCACFANGEYLRGPSKVVPDLVVAPMPHDKQASILIRNTTRAKVEASSHLID